MAIVKYVVFFSAILFSINFAQKNITEKFYETQDSTKGLMNVNKLHLPLDNKGFLASVLVESPAGLNAGFYDNKVFLISGGFYLSGYSNDEMWSNSVLWSDRMEDYQPGLIGSNPDSSINLLYKIDSSDPPFGSAWQEWSNAVLQGAKFYDGNGDGAYNPIDLNNNGLWDVDEDRPDIHGDQTAWCVYNDGVEKADRIYDIDPQGIEIRQTVFASAGNGTMYEDIIFIRYEISNNGSVAEIFDSVYFAAAADPVLGSSDNELAACDTLQRSGYVYNDGNDDEYGINPPAFLIKQLQGPPAFIPGVTFIDNNNDGTFTIGIDTPLDSAVTKHGKYLGEQFISGAKNLELNAFTAYHGFPNYNHPYHHQSARNYLIGGLNEIGEQLDPCTWQFGNSSSLPNCSQINPKFMYSGDPVLNEGWLATEAKDQIFVLSTGPFNIEVGKTVELIYAYIVGRGTDHLNSITKAKEIAEFAQTVYDNNFQDLPTGINDDENLIVNDFKLYQNYPNPFNPVTTIKFSIPASVTLSGVEASPTKLIVFDLLGRKVKTLVNEVKSSGTYEVKFDASALSSGVYFYSLISGSFNKTKKLLLLK